MTVLLGKLYNKKLIIFAFIFIFMLNIISIFADNVPSSNQSNTTKTIEKYEEEAQNTKDIVTVPLLAEIFGILPQAGINVDSTKYPIKGGIVIASAFYGFNIGIAALGASLIIYAIFLGLTNTVSSGTPLGQRLHTLFFPIRIAVGSVGLAPIFGGYSASQVFALWCIVQGVHFADLVWTMAATSYLDNFKGVPVNPSGKSGTGSIVDIPATAQAALENAINTGGVNQYALCNNFVQQVVNQSIANPNVAIAINYIYNNIGYSKNFITENQSPEPATPPTPSAPTPKLEKYPDFCGSLILDVTNMVGSCNKPGATACSPFISPQNVDFYGICAIYNSKDSFPPKVEPQFAGAQAACKTLTSTSNLDLAFNSEVTNISIDWNNLISETWNYPGNIKKSNAGVQSLINDSNFFQGTTSTEMCKNATTGSFSWTSFICYLAEIQNDVANALANDPAILGKEVEKAKQSLNLGWIFAATTYFGFSSITDTPDIFAQIGNNLSVTYKLPSNIPNYSLSNALSSNSGCPSKINNTDLTNASSKFSTGFNQAINSLLGVAYGNFFADSSTGTGGIAFKNAVIGDKFTFADLGLGSNYKAFQAKALCLSCFPPAAFQSLLNTSSCNGIAKTDCYNKNGQWAVNGTVLGAISQLGNVSITFNSLLSYLNAAVSTDLNNPSTTFNEYSASGADSGGGIPSGNNSGPGKNSMSQLQQNYSCFIKNKYQDYENVITKYDIGQPTNPPASSPALQEISGIFTSSGLATIMKNASVKIGTINLGLDISMGVIGGIASEFAKDIVSGPGNNIMQQINEVSEFPLIKLSQRGNNIAQSIEFIVEELIPFYAIFQSVASIANLFSSNPSSGNLWQDLTSLVGGIVEGAVYFAANNSGYLNIILEAQLWILLVVVAVVSPLYMLALSMFYLPMIPLIIFLYAVFAWFMTVIEAVIAAPILAIGIMHPSGDEVFGKSENGLLMLVNAMLRPMLIIIGFVSAFVLFRIALVIYNLFFGAMLEFLTITSIGVYITFIGTYIGGMIPLVTRVYSLTNQIPENVMTWIGGTHAGARGDAQEALQGMRSGAQAAPGEVSSSAKGAAGAVVMGKQLKDVVKK